MGEMHVPAVAGVVVAFSQHLQAVHPAVARAEAEQQQPPRHWLEAQSKALAQASPGEKVAHEPLPGKQPLQPMASAVALQQKPPLQAPEGQEELEAQGEPEAVIEGAAAAAVPEKERPLLHW